MNYAEFICHDCVQENLGSPLYQDYKWEDSTDKLQQRRVLSHYGPLNPHFDTIPHDIQSYQSQNLSQNLSRSDRTPHTAQATTARALTASCKIQLIKTMGDSRSILCLSVQEPVWAQQGLMCQELKR